MWIAQVGFSIPAQREADQRKANQLGATIIEEFVDAGGPHVRLTGPN